MIGSLPRIGRKRSLRPQRAQRHGLRLRRRRRWRSPGSLLRRVKNGRLRHRQESQRKHMPQREQRKRLPLRSEPRWRPKELCDRGQGLRQGPRLMLIPSKRWRR